MANKSYTATEVKTFLGLNTYPYVYFQKARNARSPLVIITYNSKRPGIAIARNYFKDVQTTSVIRHTQGKFLSIKLTPPQLAEEISTVFHSRTVFFVRDLIGDFFIDMFS